jgi:hypothetical protein
MSLWDRFFAPGDLRARQSSQPAPPPAPPAKPKPPPIQRIGPEHRVRRQNALLYGGLAFTFLSLFITRRSLVRKKLQTPPPLAPGQTAPTTTKADGSLEAVEALGLATLNVFSFAMAGIGAAATYFNVADIEDLRQGVRRGMGYDVYGGDEDDADREIETWIAETLARKDGGLREGVVERLVEMEGRRKAEEEEKKRGR